MSSIWQQYQRPRCQFTTGYMVVQLPSAILKGHSQTRLLPSTFSASKCTFKSERLSKSSKSLVCLHCLQFNNKTTLSQAVLAQLSCQEHLQEDNEAHKAAFKASATAR